MVLRLTQLLGVLLATLAISTTNAMAQGDPDQIVQAAVNAMHRVTNATVDNITEAAHHGVAVIERLDNNGATDEELIEAARRAVRAVRREAEHGRRHIRLIAARAFNALRETDAGPRYYQRVREAAANSNEAIGNAAQRGTHAIQVALRNALDD